MFKLLQASFRLAAMLLVVVAVAVPLIAGGVLVATVAVESGPVRLDFTPGGSRAYVNNSESNTVSVIDTRSQRVVATIPVGVQPQDAAVSPDGAEVWVSNRLSGTVMVVDVATNQVTNEIVVDGLPKGRTCTAPPSPFGPFGMALTADGRDLLVSNRQGNSILMIDTQSLEIDETISVGSDPHGVAVRPDGRRAYVANYGANSISVIQLVPRHPRARP